MKRCDDVCSPYFRAWREHHEGGAPGVAWREVVDFHLQHGVVHATEDFFLMARPVEREDGLLENGIGHWAPGSGWWHVWVLVGDLEQAVRQLLLGGAVVSELSWTRYRGGGLRRCGVEEFLRGARVAARCQRA